MVSRGGKGGKGGKKDPESKPKTLSSAPMAARGPTSPRRPESPRPQKNRKASRKPKKAKLDADREKEETQSVHDEEEMAGLSGAYGLMDSVVKVFCTHTEPNYSLPWQRKRQISSTSSGFVISTKDRQILTNAHSVEYHTQVKVKRCGSDEKHVARVLSIGIECDIAMLTVDDESFWEDLEAIEFGKLPLLQDDVCVIGFPVGGSEISVTSGVVSRVDVTSYVHGATELLSLQIDAAINSGNSGGPVFDNEGKCVGIAFQSMKNEDVENCGYVIPATVVEHFIDDFKRHSEYTGFPSIGIEWQSMENEHLRASQGMKRDQKGILVTRVSAASPAAGKIKKGDILLDFASTSIGNDGTIELRTRERISFTWLISQKFSGDKGNLSLLRDRKKMKVVVPLKPLKRLVPVHIDGRNPSYYIIAGLFFTPLNYKYLKSEYGKDYSYEAPVHLLVKTHDFPTSMDQEVVVLSSILAADVNVGYDHICNTEVLKFNGQKISSLRQLARLVETCQTKYMRFDLEYSSVVILESAKAKASTGEIMETHCIPDQMSQDVKDYLKADL